MKNQELDIVSTIVKYKNDQKSMIFLYPLLQFPKTMAPPLGTYLDVVGVDLDERYLYCLYYKNQQGIEEVRNSALKHNMYVFSFSDNEYEIFVFDFYKLPKTYDAVCAGQYSKIEAQAKIAILIHNHPLAKIALHPEMYYEDFAYHMECDIQQIIDRVELIPEPVLENEKLNVGKQALIDIKKEVEL